jgi:kynurenine formamidase
MNSELYGKTYTVPQDVIEYLEQCNQAVGEVDETTEGFKRNKDLREKGEITYQQLKRMKNWFDNFNGHQDEPSHILNGGHYVKNWVEKTLKGDRDTIDANKQSKSEVLPNQHIKPHEKDGMVSMNRPSQSHNSSINKYDTAITESLKRINELMKKI